MVVEIALTEISKCLDVHCLLNHCKLFLKRVVLKRLHKGENAVSRLLIDGHLLHGEHLRVNSGPVRFWHAKDLSLGGGYHFLLSPIRHFLL